MRSGYREPEPARSRNRELFQRRGTCSRIKEGSARSSNSPYCGRSSRKCVVGSLGSSLSPAHAIIDWRFRTDPSTRRQGWQFCCQSIQHSLHEALSQRARPFSLDRQAHPRSAACIYTSDRCAARMRLWLGASGPTQAPGGKAGNSAANPFSIPCTRLWHRAPAFFFGPTSPSASSNVKPCTRDQHARIAPAIFRSLRAVWGITCPSPPAMITPASSTLVFSASASSMSGAIVIRPAQITSEHQAIERRIFNAMIDVGPQHRE